MKENNKSNMLTDGLVIFFVVLNRISSLYLLILSTYAEINLKYNLV
ncbi:hypothetical protein AB2T57_16780 [Clostridium butyricum]